MTFLELCQKISTNLNSWEIVIADADEGMGSLLKLNNVEIDRENELIIVGGDYGDRYITESLNEED